MKEDIITIKCMKCFEEKKINQILWVEGKIFICDICGHERFKKVI